MKVKAKDIDGDEVTCTIYIDTTDIEGLDTTLNAANKTEFETYYKDKKIEIPEDLVIVNDQYSKVITEAGNEYAKTYVVPNGKTFYIRHFNTSCPGKCCICAGLYWDYDTENEECLIDSCS